jgi:BirA family biotin operon repressor/biotin-[acetyl-CoA-carboxylase] ligase|tara:strand:- start:594 stop:1127 length:534 start_codon:yes stop_codon:yes gene_type:complete
MKIRKFTFKNVISTNNTAFRIIQNSNLNSGMIISEVQKKGKGQYGRKWISYKGNLFVSFFFNLKKVNLSIQQLTKINCLLVKKTINNFYKKKIIFKAPNDLLINGKKISGILQETMINKNHKFLIVGIGINIVKSPNIKNYPTTNLLEVVGKKIDYNLIANLLRSIFEKNILRYYKL